MYILLTIVDTQQKEMRNYTSPNMTRISRNFLPLIEESNYNKRHLTFYEDRKLEEFHSGKLNAGHSTQKQFPVPPWRLYVNIKSWIFISE